MSTFLSLEDNLKSEMLFLFFEKFHNIFKFLSIQSFLRYRVKVIVGARDVKDDI